MECVHDGRKIKNESEAVICSHCGATYHGPAEEPCVEEIQNICEKCNKSLA